jgi:hypothetical protein
MSTLPGIIRIQGSHLQAALGINAASTTLS